MEKNITSSKNEPPDRKLWDIPPLSFRKARRAYPESSKAAGRGARLIEEETSGLYCGPAPFMKVIRKDAAAVKALVSLEPLCP
jgi:hypothetical protein